jgi:mono/diheme cytochrome c family protein
MKRFVLSAAAALLFASVAVAVDAPKEPKVLEAKQGAVTFKHTTHAAQKCAVCHGEGAPKAIGKMEKEKAHGLCLECHKKEGKGPAKCGECHKK